jgi:hypothetical protein
MSESRILTRRQFAKTKRVAKIKGTLIDKKYYYDQVILNIFSLTSLSSIYTTSRAKAGLIKNDYRKLGHRVEEGQRRGHEGSSNLFIFYQEIDKV